jgi:ribosomal protein S18 acetylase RimI-like enzyme
MKEEEIPDYNIFMICDAINSEALSELTPEYTFRNCLPEDLELWKAFPFDSSTVPPEHEGFMNQFIQDTYSKDMEIFYKNTIFICDLSNNPIATCSHWKAYGKFTSIQWLKTLKSQEGKGLGRAVLSKVVRQIKSNEYPIYLHTQPGSYRAIQLYSDFGFKILRGGKLGTRTNDLEKCIPILKEFIPQSYFEKLQIIDTPKEFISLLETETTIQF